MRSDNVKFSHWKLFYPGECYTGDLAYYEPVCEKEVRADVRERYGVKKLPTGTYVEPGSTMDWYNALSPEAKRERDFIHETA